MYSKQYAIEYRLYIMSHDRALRAGIDSQKFEFNNDKGQKLHSKTSKLEQLQKAKSYFLKALKVAGSNAYAKSAIYHNLGTFHNTHYGRLPGGNVENLNKAMVFLEKALNCKERMVFSDRCAYTLTQMAVTWRKAAHEYLWPDPPEVCFEKAERLSHIALEKLKQNCPLPAALAARAHVLMNLSSILLNQEKDQEACSAVCESYRSYMEARRLISPVPILTEMDMTHLLVLTFSRLHYVGSAQKKYKKICDEILTIAPQYGVTEDQLYFTPPDIDGNSLIVEVALLNSNIRHNPTPKSIQAAREKLLQLCKKRHMALTDQAADDITRHIQMLSSGIARGLIHHGKCLEAFIALENVSAMRFTESQSINWFLPENKLQIALYQVQRQIGALYYAVNEANLFYQINSSNNHRDLFFEKSNEVFEKLYENKVKLEGTEVIFNSSIYPTTFKKASSSAKPEKLFKSLSDDVLSDFHKVEQELIRQVPGHKKYLDDVFSIKLNHVEQVLREYEELTLLKIDQESGHDDLLLIVIYAENGKICSNSYKIPAPGKLTNSIADIVHEHKDIQIDDWDLSFINWKKILPPGKKQIAILPSYYAAHIPWAATGSHGCRLLDLVDEVLWLPSILSLCYRPKHFRQRTSIARLSGGGTLFTEHAHTGLSCFNTCKGISKKRILEKIASSDVMSFYGHAEHNHPDRPKILFEDFSIYDQQVGRETCGMSRVELWACQSGSNIPQQFMGSPVNEAFGMDMKMLEFGAETAIGTLWAVPELVTSHIKRYYDTLVSNGVKASKALILAQRWWINSGADQQLDLIKKIGIKQYLKSLGYEGSDNSMTSALMGPLLASKANDYPETLEQKFKHPSAWAGLRFCGVPEHKSIHIPAEQVRFTEQDLAELKGVLNKLQLTWEYV